MGCWYDRLNGDNTNGDLNAPAKMTPEMQEPRLQSNTSNIDAQSTTRIESNIQPLETRSQSNSSNEGEYDNAFWKAGGETTPLCTMSNLPSVLHASGILVDIIHDLGIPLFGDDNPLDFYFNSWEETMIRNFGNSKTSDGDSIKAVHDRMRRLDRIRQKMEKDGESRRKHVQQLVSRAQFSWRRIKRFKEVRKNYQSSESQSSDYVGGGTILEAHTRTLFMNSLWGMTSPVGSYETMKARSSKICQRCFLSFWRKQWRQLRIIQCIGICLFRRRDTWDSAQFQRKRTI
jgi:hypothetical protein